MFYDKINRYYWRKQALSDMDMTMKEIEQDILNDLAELQDAISQYSYLLECAGELRSYPEEYRTDAYLIRDCQVRTWLHPAYLNEVCSFEADSESLIIRGALALLQEIYDKRPHDEIRDYQCGLLEYDDFTKHYNAEQLKGLRSMLKLLEQ